MPTILLTPQQLAALGYICSKIGQGARLIALRGLAGTGKSTLIPPLVERLRQGHLEIGIGTPTHRAAVLLRANGLLDADTIHALSLIPLFTPEYEAALEWLRDDPPGALIPALSAHAYPQPLALHAWRRTESPVLRLRAIGIRARDDRGYLRRPWKFSLSAMGPGQFPAWTAPSSFAVLRKQWMILLSGQPFAGHPPTDMPLTSRNSPLEGHATTLCYANTE